MRKEGEGVNGKRKGANKGEARCFLPLLPPVESPQQVRLAPSSLGTRDDRQLPPAWVESCRRVRGERVIRVDRWKKEGERREIEGKEVRSGEREKCERWRCPERRRGRRWTRRRRWLGCWRGSSRELKEDEARMERRRARRTGGRRYEEEGSQSRTGKQSQLLRDPSPS